MARERPKDANNAYVKRRRLHHAPRVARGADGTAFAGIGHESKLSWFMVVGAA